MTAVATPTVPSETACMCVLALAAGVCHACAATASDPRPIASCSLICNPRDSRCRYWAKVVRASDPLPMPGDVSGANDIPGPYLRAGDDVEIFEGDFLLEGEANHHVKSRGWTYDLRGVDANGKDYQLPRGREVKDAIRADKGAPRALLLGSGDCAAMIRAIHWARRTARDAIGGAS